jgi:hypothetical protein
LGAKCLSTSLDRKAERCQQLDVVEVNSEMPVSQPSLVEVVLPEVCRPGDRPAGPRHGLVEHFADVLGITTKHCHVAQARLLCPRMIG